MKNKFEQMKMVIIFLAFLYSISACTQNTHWAGNGRGRFITKPKNAYVLVITGQSNANSHGDNLSPLFTANATRTSHYDTTSHAFLTYSNVGIIQTGFESQTAGLQAVSKSEPIIYVIRAAQGSLAISNWDIPNGTMWLYLKNSIQGAFAALRAQGYTPVLLSTIYLQGEQDCVIGTSTATYQSKLSSLIDNYRAIDPAVNNTQFVIVKLREDSGDPTYQPGSVANINTAYVNVFSQKSNIKLIRPEDINAVHISSSDIHYTQASFILIANAWNNLTSP